MALRQFDTAISLQRPMFDLERILLFHLELTDKCNAACPMCGRTQPADRCRPDRAKVKNIELTLGDICKAFTPKICRRILQIDLCGGLGDPPAASQCLEICEYFVAQGVIVTLSTNGGLRNAKWWRQLGEIFRRNDSLVEFHVDGLEDTNHLYRVNTRFSKIMENARHYLDSGATGEWHFIVFRHNQHQVEEAVTLSRQLGFSNFKLIDTIRFGKEKRFEYQAPDGNIRCLEPSTMPAVDLRRNTGQPDVDVSATSYIENRDSLHINGIKCKSAIQNRPYIVADGSVSACCWIQGSDDEKQMYLRASHKPENHNILQRPLEEILTEEPFISIYRSAWENGNNPVCIRKCGQMRRNVRLTL